MTTATFDTHQAVRRLEAAGIDQHQAEAIVSEMRDAVGENVATKADLAAAVADLKADMLKVAIGIIVAVVALNVALATALIRLFP